MKGWSLRSYASLCFVWSFMSMGLVINDWVVHMCMVAGWVQSSSAAVEYSAQWGPQAGTVQDSIPTDG